MQFFRRTDASGLTPESLTVLWLPLDTAINVSPSTPSNTCRTRHCVRDPRPVPEECSMKAIRMVALAAALVAGTSVVAEAQRAGGGGGARGQGGMMRMTPAQQADTLLKEITVTAEVKTQVVAIITKYQGERQQMMQAARGGGGGDMQSMQARAQELQAKQTEEIKKLLTAEQGVQFDKNVAAMTPQRRGPPPALRR
jgi:Spy/CpxP family protein refolding chaperone